MTAAVLSARYLHVGAGLLSALAIASHGVCAQAVPPTEVHGSLDAFAAPSVALAWGVLRGKDEAATEVVVRIDADPKTYRSLSVTGVDPFTKASQALLAVTPLEGTLRVRLPRARFAELPRTEWRLYASPTPTASATAALVVYYESIPDTTPEFDVEARLLTSLAQRIERAQHDVKAK